MVVAPSNPEVKGWKFLRTVAIAPADADYVGTQARPAAADRTAIPYRNPGQSDQVVRDIVFVLAFFDSAGASVAPTGTFTYEVVQTITTKPANEERPKSFVIVGQVPVAAANADEIHLVSDMGPTDEFAIRLHTAAGFPATDHIRVYWKEL